MDDKQTVTTSKITLSKFKESGWKFGEKRLRSAKKRQREGMFTELKPLKRGRAQIAKDLQEKIIQE